ncbi:MAG TPA: MBL fold hydrolase [Nitrospirota bacterium]|nr:MBL fold hydrolase [Nitrospirota bacterium]
MVGSIKNDGPVEISPGVYWVGSSTSDLLRRNVYLRVYAGKGDNYSMLVDPGPPQDFEIVYGKVCSVIKDPEHLNLITINHQDPDVGASTPRWLKLNPKIIVLMSEDTWRLAQYFGIEQRNFKAVERFKDKRVPLPTGHVLQFVPTPFCHFRGACMVYDIASRILFTGDLFGGIAAMNLYADDSSWMGIKAFHQLYMPSNDALKLSVRRIRELDPPPLVIAPQHGGIIRGDLIERLLGRMEDLVVGLDIIVPLENKMPLLVRAINSTLTAAQEVAGTDVTGRVMKLFYHDASYPSIFALDEDDAVTDIKAEPLSAIDAFVRQLFRHCSEDQRNKLRMRIMKIFLEQNLPPPDSAFSEEDDQGGRVDHRGGFTA